MSLKIKKCSLLRAHKPEFRATKKKFDTLKKAIEALELKGAGGNSGIASTGEPFKLLCKSIYALFVEIVLITIIILFGSINIFLKC